ncbi:SGNH/GDSL hydrolase family protein [Butyrivibrio sp. AE3004]|uniref:SGNH/GDSL hydrolase family protein n=1 Tax=Butyrivibrio sp. AE3004 TaxID=1506994 RepID=UPI00049429A3|nr:SGNH/GDSL hydrolase family protein [Butyrivibrio sp. AE3004]
MKKRIMAGITAILLTVALTGCGDPSKLTSRKTEDNVVAEEEIKGEVSGAEASDASSNDSGEQNESGAQDSVEEGAAEAQATGDDSSAVSSGSASFDPQEIVEPELPAEEVQQPAETSVEEVVEEPAKAEEDKYYDIVFIGDSQFDNARGTASDIPSYTCALLGKKVKFYNFAIGGTAASLQRGMGIDLDTFNESCFVGIAYAFVGKIDSGFLDQYPAGAEMKKITPEKVDLYVIEYGANDYINGKDLFNPDNEFDVQTYNGALSVGISELKKASPNAKFIICGPSYCMWYNADGYAIGDSYTVSKGIGPLSEYSNTASNLANACGYDFMDSMYASQFDLKIETVDDYLSDGLHYNEKGRQVYAAVLAHRIQKLRGLDDSEMPYVEINNFDFWEYKDSLKKK